jgi:hypothetical protein
MTRILGNRRALGIEREKAKTESLAVARFSDQNIDNKIVSAIPEPFTYGLLLDGDLLLRFVGRGQMSRSLVEDLSRSVDLAYLGVPSQIFVGGHCKLNICAELVATVCNEHAPRSQS